MGDVFRGVDTGLNRKVAIKILSEKHRDSPELRARFVREGRAVAAVSHPNVVQVFATGTFDERPYIVMELLDGTDLGTTVEKGRPLDSLAAAHATLDAAQGLAAASKAGLIHRDVKPSNLVRLSDGRVKVTDFGLAKPVDPGAEPALTAMGVVVGTPDYIAPEQARGEAIDERVDIYALGGTLYFLLTGMPPFRTGKPAEDKYLKVVARHLRNPPPDAATTMPGVDRELSDLARTMMAKKPAERPSYDELVQRLVGIIGRMDPQGVPLVVSASRDRSQPIMIPSSGGVPVRPSAIAVAAPASEDSIVTPAPRAFPGWLVAVTLASLALFTAGLVVYVRRDTPAAAPAPAPPVDAGAAAVPDAAEGATPAGMILVKKPDGTPWLHADAKPVSIAAYREVYAKQGEPSKPGDAAVSISYAEARAFAAARGGRLLTAAEWDQASGTPGFIAVDGLFEWVDSPEDKKKLVKRLGKSETRTDARHKDVTFRVAKPL